MHSYDVMANCRDQYSFNEENELLKKSLIEEEHFKKRKRKINSQQNKLHKLLIGEQNLYLNKG